MDLALTKRQIDMYGVYPPDIKEMTKAELERGNPENKTLIDIHREKYSPLNACETLEEAKELFPEFKDVKSDKEAVFISGSFVYDVKNGNVEGMDPEGDVALQLLQMYWGDGTSSCDLEKNTGRSIRSTMEKLKIPFQDRVYARYLKMSDKEFNAQYSQNISQKSREAAMRKKETGTEYHSNLSDEHKEKISLGLRRFYCEHPERLGELSEQMSEYYEEHREEKERFTQVMLRAWDYKEAKPIRKAMARLMRKNEITDEDIKNSLEVNFKERLTFNDFWKRNPWARDKFTLCVEKSWKRQDELTKIGLIYEPAYKAELIPRTLKTEAEKSSDVKCRI